MAQLNIRVDDDLKNAAENVCDGMGMSLSTAINVYLKRLVRENGIPFDVSADPLCSGKSMKNLGKATSGTETDGNSVTERGLAGHRPDA